MPDPSPSPLTPEELRELERLEREATAAPWSVGDGGPKALYERCVILCSFGDSDTRILFTANHHFESEHDLALVSALRNAAPRILSELAALREENERLRACNVVNDPAPVEAHCSNCGRAWCVDAMGDARCCWEPSKCNRGAHASAPAQEAREG